MYRIIALSLLVLCTLSSVADAGCIFRRNCGRVVVTRAIVAQKVVDVQFTPTFVSFVPSQVLLNGQVTTYGAPQAFSYSYQGGYQTQAQVQAKNGNALEQRLARLENLLLKLAGEGVGVASAGSHAASANGTFGQSCKGCHSPGGKGFKDLKMYDASGNLLDKLPRYKIYKSITDGRMPKNGPKLEDKGKLEAIRLWVHEGLAELEY